MTVLTMKEAAELMRISVAMVSRLVHTQGLPHMRIGRRVFFPKDRLERWLEEQVKEEELA